MTPAEYARRRGLSRERVRQVIQKGRLSLDANGKLDPAVADREWAATEDLKQPRPANAKGRPAKAAPPPTVDGHAINYHRTRREAALASQAELELAEARGRLVDRDAIFAAMATVNRETRDRLLLLPGELGGQLAAETDPGECSRLLTLEMRRALEELAGPEGSS